MNTNKNRLQTQADQFLLQHFSPAAVLINAEGDIICINGRHGKYLEVPSSKDNWNIHVMAHKDLQHDLSVAIQKAQEQVEPVNIRNLALDINIINLTVQAISEPKALLGLLMVVFTDVVTPVKSPRIKHGCAEKEALNKLKQAHEESQSLREKLQSASEELNTSKEELQSASAELHSINEELHSKNEEMQTVNTELVNKVDDLSWVNNDMKKLLDSTEIATIFLDNNQHIRRFTPHISTLFFLMPSDVGRPLSDLVNNLNYLDLKNNVSKVLDTLMFIEKEVTASNERWFKVRIMPYRTHENLIDGVVITFIDITDSKRVEAGLENTRKELEKTLEDLERIFSLSAYMVCLTSPEGNFQKVSPAFSETLGFSEKEFLTKPFVDFVHPDDKESTAAKMEPLARGIPIIKFPNRYMCKDGSYKWLEWTARSFVEGGDIYAIAYDITDRKIAEQKLERITLKYEAHK